MSDACREQRELDGQYYLDAVRAKCEPLLSAFFVREEVARATVKPAASFFGSSLATAVVAPKLAADRAKLPGQNEAQLRLARALERARQERFAADPKPERGEKRRVDAFAKMMAASQKKRK